MKDKSQFAIVDPMFISDGVFIPRTNASKNTDIKKQWDNGSVHFFGKQLNAIHQSVLLAICARSGRDKKTLSEDGHENSIELLEGLKQKDSFNNISNKMKNSVIETRLTDILIDASLSNNGKNNKKIIQILKELSAFTIYREVSTLEKNKKVTIGMSSHLLSFIFKDNLLIICLNWRLSDALLGSQKTMISLSERGKLKSPIDKILHAWFSSHVRIGGHYMAKKGAKLDTIVQHIWGDDNVSRQIKNARRWKTIKAIIEIGMLPNWQTNIDKNKHVTVSRVQTEN